MRRLAAGLVPLAMGGMIVACSSDKLDTPGLAALGPIVTAPALAQGEPVLDPETLQAAILGTADLPVGFVPLADPTQDLGLLPAAEPTEPARSRTTPPACAAVLSPIADVAPGSVAGALSRFGGPDFTSIDIDVASYPDLAAAQAFTRVQELFGQCLHFTGSDLDGVDIDYHIGGLDQAQVGDASVAFRVLTGSDGVTLTTDVVVAVVGSTVVQVAATGQLPIDSKVLTDIVKRQVDRLRAVPGT